MNIAYRLRAVRKRYANGFEALKGVDLDIAAGSFVVVLGPSGAGKSTLLRTLNGLERIDGGAIECDGTVLSAHTLRAIRSRSGMIFQQFNLVGRLSVMTNVLTGRLSRRSWLGSVFGLFRGEDMEIARRVLHRVGLLDKAWQRADRLSGGQQQRVGIARALAQQPRVILADEPVASLDPLSSAEVMNLLAEINRDDGITVVVNLHQVELARRYADRVIGLNAGRVVYDGPPEGLDRDTLTRIYRREEIDHDPQLEAVLAYA